MAESTCSTSSEATNPMPSPGKSHLRILLVGKTGVGKSALINALVGYEVSLESDIESGTHEVEEINADLHGGIKATFYDSPGLHDAKGNEKDYLQQIIDVSQDLDLILFCSKLTDTRVTQEDCDTICEFTRVLGKDFWKNSVFVLTFANNVRPKTGLEDPEKKKKALTDKLQQLSKKLREVLRKKAGVPSTVVKSIPFVPAGYHSPEHQILPDGTHWFSCFWAACFIRVRDVGKPAVIKGCLDMFEIEDEKSKMQKDLPPEYKVVSYPMPELCPPPTYSRAVVHSNMRSIPMAIRLSNVPAHRLIFEGFSKIMTGGLGITGQLISAVVGVGISLLEHFMESDDDDELD